MGKQRFGAETSAGFCGDSLMRAPTTTEERRRGLLGAKNKRWGGRFARGDTAAWGSNENISRESVRHEGGSGPSGFYREMERVGPQDRAYKNRPLPEAEDMRFGLRFRSGSPTLDKSRARIVCVR